MKDEGMVYHIVVLWNTSRSEPRGSGRFYISEAELVSVFVDPYLAGKPFYLQGRKIEHDNVDEITILRSDSKEKRGFTLTESQYAKVDDFVKWSELIGVLVEHWADVTDDFIKVGNEGTEKNSVDATEIGSTGESSQVTTESEKRKVFVVHGRMLGVRDAMFEFLESAGLTPMPWEEMVGSTVNMSPSNLEVVKAGAKRADAFLVIITPDDIGRMNPAITPSAAEEHERNYTPQPRLNVVFETGLAMGIMREKTVVVEFGRTRPFSDLEVNAIRINRENEIKMREAILDRLSNQGLSVSKVGSRWQTAGKFPFDEIDAVSQIDTNNKTNRDNGTAYIGQLEKLTIEVGSGGYAKDHEIARYEDILKNSGLSEKTLSELNVCSDDYVTVPKHKTVLHPVTGRRIRVEKVPGPSRILAARLNYKIADAILYLKGELGS